MGIVSHFVLDLTPRNLSCKDALSMIYVVKTSLIMELAVVGVIYIILDQVKTF
jgi:hypothetical protein